MRGWFGRPGAQRGDLPQPPHTASFQPADGRGSAEILFPHPRFERGLNDPESFVLPLHQRGVGGRSDCDPLTGLRRDRFQPVLIRAEVIESSRVE